VPFVRRGSVRIHYGVHEGPADRAPLPLSHGFSTSGRMGDRNVSLATASPRLGHPDARKVSLWGVGRAADIEVAEAFNSGVPEFLEEI
jgi:hypothetical protein